MRGTNDDEYGPQGTYYNVTIVNRGSDVKHSYNHRLGVNDVNSLSIIRRHSTEDCKLQGTIWFLDPSPR
jgi:hypothetical protein